MCDTKKKKNRKINYIQPINQDSTNIPAWQDLLTEGNENV